MSQSSTILTARSRTNEIIDYLTASGENWDVLCAELAKLSISEDLVLAELRENPLRWRTAPLMPLLVAEDGDTLDVNEVQGISEELNRICASDLVETIQERRNFNRLTGLMSATARRGGMVFLRS